MNPYEAVTAHYEFPFDFYGFQQGTLNELAPLLRAGYYLDMGTGKTAVSTAAALYKKLTRPSATTLVIMPPILITGWARWLRRIKPPLDVVAYRGTPKERKLIRLRGDFILMSMQIFKKDYARIVAELGTKDADIIVIVDEATSIKNVGSDNHKKVRDFSAGRDLMLLTGTPISSPGDAYAYIKLVAPGTYRNQNQFENIHVAERDFFDKITKWQNLELIASNMKVNSVRLMKEEVLPDLPEETINPVYYELEPDHYRLYQKLAEEQLLRLKDGGKIDATQATALFYALQQIVVNYSYFSQKEGVRSAAYDVLDQVLAECAGKKLLVAANYRLTNRNLYEYLKPHGAVAIYGEISPRQKEIAKERFIDDPDCPVAVIQPMSAGYGVDGWQHVCSDMLFLETPLFPTPFHQAVDRLHRDGQKFNINVRIAVAERTLQVRLLENLLQKDEIVNVVVPSWKDLRDAIYGGDLKQAA